MISKKGQFKRGEVHLVEEHQSLGSEQKKTRPWVLVGATPINKARRTVVGIPLSTSAPEIPPTSIKIYFNNLNQCAVLDQIRALDKNRLIRFEGCLDQHDIESIDENLRQVLGL